MELIVLLEVVRQKVAFRVGSHEFADQVGDAAGARLVETVDVRKSEERDTVRPKYREGV